MYWLEHFLHVIQFTRFLVLQFNSCVISAMNDVAVALIFFPCCIKGHIGHPLHLVEDKCMDMPGINARSS